MRIKLQIYKDVAVLFWQSCYFMKIKLLTSYLQIIYNLHVIYKIG